LNTVLDISNKIIQCSQNDQLEIIISLRAFLFDIPIYSWVDLTYSKNYEEDIALLHNKNIFELKSLNEKNLKKIYLKPIDLFLLPRNKKNYLISLIDEIFEDFSLVVIFDKIRTNPFLEDALFEFIKNNKNQFSDKIFITYKTRNDNAKELVSLASIEPQIYETCFTLSRKNKIINYWENIWADSYKYNEPNLIQNLILK
jgi:hypothetical protein